MQRSDDFTGRSLRIQLARLIESAGVEDQYALQLGSRPVDRVYPVDVCLHELHRGYVAGLERFGAGFEQLILSADGAVMESGTGEVWLQRPDRFRWAYHGDFPELIVADGDRVWMYDEGLDQVTVRLQSELAGDSPLLVILDLDRLDERFAVTELGTVTGLQFLELTARSADAQFERLVLGFANGALQRLVLEDAFGMRTELTFREVTRNPEIPESHFRFTPPEGVDLVFHQRNQRQEVH